jgi:DNA-binding winged helix-turn-helix (wHTH) protein/TolB-like protein/tetratricopeptide (TPR) repeat protein
MYEATRGAIWARGIDLAQQADFDLGSLRVRPARCEVEGNGGSQTLQRRVMQVLVALAEGRGAVVSQDDLVIRCWRGLSVSDDAIYRCISKLRKLAASFPEATFAIEAIPGVGYRLTSTRLDEGGLLKEAVPRLQDSRFQVRALMTAAALLAVILAGIAFWIFEGRGPDHQPLRIAVRPFETLTDSADVRSLARRIPNEVADALGDSQFETVLTDEQAGKEAIGSSPAHGLVVTGIVRGDGPDSIVDVRVEDGSTRAALWSTEFTRDNRQASDLPLEVAARIADVVDMIYFARTADPPLTDDSALTALLQTSEMIRDTEDGAWAPMLEKAGSIVARHPDFAFGHSVLASAFAEAAGGIPIPDRAHAMRDAARREAILTLNLDPEDAGAYAVLSGLLPRSNYSAREKILLSGIKFAKHPKEPLGALYSYEGTLLSDVGRLREALAFQLIAQATDEWGPPKTVKVALIYANMGNLPAARAWIERAVQRWPNHSAVRSYRLYIAGFYEQPDDALAIIKVMGARSFPDEIRAAVWRAFVEAKAAHSAQLTRATVARIGEAADQNEISREVEIMMLAALGERRQAINVANSALDRGEELPARFLFTPIMSNVRTDPGFVPLASRLGLVRYWRDAGKRPDFCTDERAPRECSAQLLEAMVPNSPQK